MHKHLFLRVSGGVFTENVFREIVALTDSSLLQVSSVRHDAIAKTVYLEVDRFEIVQKRKKFLFVTPYKRDRGTRIRSSIIVRNVTSCEVENNIGDRTWPQVILMYGVVIEGDRITVCSAEEEKGAPLYSMTIIVSDIDLEIKDL